MTRAEFQQQVIDTIAGVSQVKDVVVNYIPPPSKVKVFPTVAVDFPETDFERGVGKSFNIYDNIHLYIYTRSSRTNKYEDSINNLVEVISQELLTNITLNSNVLDIYVSKVKTDGGVSYPIIINRLEVKSHYISECI